MKRPLVLDRFRAVDLSHALHEGAPTWSGNCGFRLEIRVDYHHGQNLRAQNMKSHAGVGTHVDAPSHFVKGAKNIDQLPLEDLIVPACVLNLRSQMAPDLVISVAHIEAFEQEHGQVSEHSLFIASTGWEQFWSDPARYRNPDASGTMRFPHFSREAATFLLQRRVAGIGSDTLSPDPPGEGPSSYPVHRAILGAGKYILENLARLDQMPPVGAFVLSLPLKMQDAAESPARVIGLIPAL